MYTAAQIIDIRKRAWESHHDRQEDVEFTNKVAQLIVEYENLRIEIKDNPELLIELVFIIVEKEKKIVPFFLNEVQQEFINDLNVKIEEYNTGKRLSIKFLILKGRQQGFTSLITAYQLACTITRNNFEGFTAADDDNNSISIFENKAKYLFTMLPELIKPTEKYNNKKQLLFEKLHSSWEVRTATKNMGRSRTINFFHGSECAFWRDGISSIQGGIGEAITKNAIQILESTANGYNEYKDLWDSGKWENKFYEWWRTEEYKSNFESIEKKNWFVDSLNTTKGWIWDRCRWLYNEKNLNLKQVYWYHNKYQSYLNKDLIKQEYPCSSDEAFLSSGRCIFDKEKLIMRKEYLKKLYETNPPRIGRFTFEWNDPDTQDKIKIETIKWVDDINGFIKIYETPVNGLHYVAGCDTKGEGRDMYASTVKNNVTGNRAAVLHMQATNSKPYTWQVYCLGQYYNSALIGVEINFNTAPVEELQRLNYPKQYMREATDKITKDIQKKYGWKTDGNTRPRMIDTEIDLIENNIELFNDITMIDEAMTFVYDKDNRPDAETGKHDDVLISDMICNMIQGQQYMQIYEKPPEKKKLLIDTINKKPNKGFFS